MGKGLYRVFRNTKVSNIADAILKKTKTGKEKKMKKFLSMVIVLCLTFGILAGCGTSSSTSTTSVDSNQETTVAEEK